jgi:hypothetical protein
MNTYKRHHDSQPTSNLAAGFYNSMMPCMSIPNTWVTLSPNVTHDKSAKTGFGRLPNVAFGDIESSPSEENDGGPSLTLPMTYRRAAESLSNVLHSAVSGVFCQYLPKLIPSSPNSIIQSFHQDHSPSGSSKSLLSH